MSNPYYNSKDPVWAFSRISFERGEQFRTEELEAYEDSLAQTITPNIGKIKLAKERSKFVLRCVGEGLRTAPAIAAHPLASQLFDKLNGRACISMTLARLRDAGKLIRTSPGVYALLRLQAA